MRSSKKIPIPACVLALALTAGAAQNPRVVIETAKGAIVVEVDLVRAPVTAANFLRYVDAGLYDGSTFHRTVTMSNQPRDAVRIEVIQGGQLAEEREFPPIAHETTATTGLRSISTGRSPWPGTSRGRPHRASSSASTTSPNSTSAAGAIRTVRASPLSAASSPGWTSSGRSRASRPKASSSSPPPASLSVRRLETAKK